MYQDKNAEKRMNGETREDRIRNEWRESNICATSVIDKMRKQAEIT